MDSEGEVVYASGTQVKVLRGVVRIEDGLVRVTRRDTVIILPMTSVVSIEMPREAAEEVG